MMAIFRRFALILLIVCMLPASGCAPFMENNTIEEIAPVTFWYMDDAGNGKLKVSTLVPPVVKGKKRLLSMEVDLLKQGRKNFNLKYYRELKLGQLRMLFINENLAKKGIQPLLNTIMSDPDISPRIYLVTVKGDFEEYLRNQIKTPESVDYDLYRMLHHYEKRNQGEMTIVNLHRFIKELHMPFADPIMPVFQASAENFNYHGTALFQNDKLADEISGIDDQIFQLLDNKHFLKLMPLPALSATLGRVRSNTRIDIDRGGSTLSVTIDAQCRIEEYRGGKDLLNGQNFAELQSNIETYLEEHTTQLLQTMQKRKVEPLRFGTHTLHPFSETISVKDWQTLRDRMKINVDFRLHMRTPIQPLSNEYK